MSGLGYDLVEIDRSAGGLLRITIDLPWEMPQPGVPAVDQFITVEDCEKVTRQLQFALEVDGVEYRRLEVSSPGIDRPLRGEQDFERCEHQLEGELGEKEQRSRREEHVVLALGTRLHLPPARPLGRFASGSSPFAVGL